MKFLKKWLRKWLGIPELEARILDLEKHFATKRDANGKVVETLADVPLAKREELRLSTKGMSWQQRQRALEATDGGRYAPTVAPKSPRSSR